MIAALLVLIGASIHAHADSAESLTHKWRIRLSQVDQFHYEAKDYAEVTRDKEKFENLLARKGSEVLRIQRISGRSGPELHKWLTDKKLQIESVYAGSIDPYYAGVTERSECPKNATFRKLDAKDAVFYSVYASGNLTIGVCMPEDIKYHVVIALIQCGESAFMVERFFPSSLLGENRRKEVLQTQKIFCEGGK
jgi:hypothetical protein